MEVDVRRVGRFAARLALVALGVLVVVLYVAGVQKNAQITRLHRDGVPVEVTVTGCLGMMGGSGSNLAGYQCKGALMMGGQRYVEEIPGSMFLRPGSRLQAVAVPGDPALLATASALATEHSSWRVFVLPTILLLVLVLLVAVVVVTRRRPLRSGPGAAAAA